MRASPAGAHGALSGAGDVRSGGWAGRAQELLEVPGKTPQRPWRSGLSLGPLGVSDAAHAGDHVVPAEHGNDLTRPPLQGRTPVPQCLLAHILIKYLSAMEGGGGVTPSPKPGHRETECRISSYPSLTPPAPDPLLLAGAATSMQALTCWPLPCPGSRAW